MKLRAMSEPESILRRFVAFAGIIVSILGYASLVSNLLLSLFCLGICIIFLFYVRGNRALLLIATVLAYVCYSILYANYLAPITSSPYIMYRNTGAATTALSALLLFLSSLLAMLPVKINQYGRGDAFPAQGKENAPIAISILAVLVLIVVFGFKSAAVSGGGRGSQSTLFEYSTILFPVAFYFCGRSKPLKGLAYTVFFLFCFRGLASGERVTALQLILIVFFIAFSEKMRTRTLVVALIAGLFAFTVMGALRAGILSSSFEEVIKALTESFQTGLSWDTAYSAWHTSITFVLYGDIISVEQRLSLFFQWVISIFLGNSVPNSQLPVVSHEAYWHMYGGVSPIYFQFYAGIPGVLLISIYVSIILRFINKMLSRESSGSALGVICALYLTATVFRWVLYGPSQITRGLLLCFLFAGGCLWVDKSMRFGFSRKENSLGKLRCEIEGSKRTI